MTSNHAGASQQPSSRRSFDDYNLPASLSILIVEDDPPAQMLMEELLPKTYDVKVVSQSTAAKARMAETNYDLVLVDIGLEGDEDGLELLYEMDASGYWADTKSIAVTAYALPGDRRRILDAGFDHYIAKPFSRETFLRTIADVIDAA